MSKVGGGKNYGYGKQIIWAGKEALKDHFITRKYGSEAAHMARWEVVCEWLAIQGIKDAREIDLFVIVEYGNHLAEEVNDEEKEESYAQNLISSINVILSTMRHDNKLWVSPCALVGARTHFRTDPPIHMDWDDVRLIQRRLVEGGQFGVAAMVGLARSAGLRFKECSLLDAKAALKKAIRDQTIDVTLGTKGGHERTVQVNELAIEALQFAADCQAGTCVIPVGLSYVEWRNKAYYHYFYVGGSAFHDFRAAFACDLYKALTGYPAPILRMESEPNPNREEDRQARLQISEQLGHHREDVVSSYIGPILRKKRNQG